MFPMLGAAAASALVVLASLAPVPQGVVGALRQAPPPQPSRPVLVDALQPGFYTTRVGNTQPVALFSYAQGGSAANPAYIYSTSASTEVALVKIYRLPCVGEYAGLYVMQTVGTGRSLNTFLRIRGRKAYTVLQLFDTLAPTRLQLVDSIATADAQAGREFLAEACTYLRDFKLRTAARWRYVGPAA